MNGFAGAATFGRWHGASGRQLMSKFVRCRGGASTNALWKVQEVG